MLNTQKFNRGKFNILSSDAASANGTIIATSGMFGSPYIIFSAAGSINATGGIESVQPALIIQAEGEPMIATSALSGVYYRRVEAIGGPIQATGSITAKVAEIYGIDTISLPNLVLEPGQELIIDTDDMTVTLDGQNAIHLLSDDSIFFLLAQGENIITYTDQSGDRQANIKVMRKDRWL